MNEQAFRDVLNRRTFLDRSLTGVGAIALAQLLGPGGPASVRGAVTPMVDATKPERWTGILPGLHYSPRAKRVIHLCMAGVVRRKFLHDDPAAQIQNFTSCCLYVGSGQYSGIRCLGFA